MAYEIEIPSTNIVEDTSKAVIAVNDPTADIIANQDRSVDVYSCTYVVVCDDIYIKNYVDQIPAWMQTYIENVTAVGLASTNSSLNDILNRFSALQDGYTATIASVTTDLDKQNATIESLVTRTDNAIAGISTTMNTKIDETQALALISQEIATFRDFGLTEASAWWQSIINTVVTEQKAQATQLTTLNSGLNNNSASVNTLQSAVTTLDSAVAKSAQYVTASVGGTKLITGFALTSSIDPEGEQISSVVFNANDFRIYTTTTIPDDTATPVFSVSGRDITFNGKVSFNNVTDYTAPKIGINLMPLEYSTFNAPSLPVTQYANCYLKRRTDIDWVKYGGSTLMFWATAPDAYVVLSDNTKDAYNVKVPAGTKIVVSVWVKVNTGTGAVQLYINESNGTYYAKSQTIPLNTWTRVHLAHTMVTSSFRVRVDSDGYSGTNVATSIDGVMVEVDDGSGLPSDFVEGNSGLATSTLSNVTTIDGGKITTNSIAANKINSYALTTTNATIANSVIKTAMIADAQITNAKIADLSVSTLKIADQAVTVPASVYSSFAPLYGNNTWLDVGNTALNLTGISCNVFILANLNVGQSYSSQYNRSKLQYKNSSTSNIWIDIGKEVSFGVATGKVPLTVTYSGVFTGYTYFRVVWLGNSSQADWIYDCSLIVIGTKK